jgi:hypothetical protein
MPEARSDRVEDLGAELDAIIDTHNAQMAQASGDDGVLDGRSELDSAKSVVDATLSKLRDLKARTVAAERELSTSYQEAHAKKRANSTSWSALWVAANGPAVCGRRTSGRSARQSRVP